MRGQDYRAQGHRIQGHRDRDGPGPIPASFARGHWRLEGYAAILTNPWKEKDATFGYWANEGKVVDVLRCNGGKWAVDATVADVLRTALRVNCDLGLDLFPFLLKFRRIVLGLRGVQRWSDWYYGVLNELATRDRLPFTWQQNATKFNRIVWRLHVSDTRSGKSEAYLVR